MLHTPSRVRAVTAVVTSLLITAMAGSVAAGVMWWLRPRPLPAATVAPPAEQSRPKELVGLWTRWPDAKSEGDRVRFYFFHESGVGLYRYGQIGLNNTNSFDWRVDDDGVLVLRFRKTGVEERTPFSISGGGDAPRTLLLTHDPKEPWLRDARARGITSYTFVPAPLQAAHAPDLVAAADDESAAAAAGPVPGRLWMHQERFATGGTRFSLYQLKGAAIDGRGVGWHHVGDFDDWSTEALTFRYSASSCKQEASFEVWFTVRGEHVRTAALRAEGGGPHAEGGDLVLVEDPRNFHHVQRYKDAGPAFGSFRLFAAPPALN